VTLVGHMERMEKLGNLYRSLGEKPGREESAW